MKTTGFNPRALVDRVLSDAERALKNASGGATEISKAAAGALPGPLRELADGFDGLSVSRSALLGALSTRLEQALERSLAMGTFLPDELDRATTDLVAFSSAALQLQQLLASRAKSPTAFETDQRAMSALASADASAASQLEVHQALRSAADAHRAEDPKSAAAEVLAEVVKQRAKLLREVADNTVKAAEAFASSTADPAARAAVRAALDVAVEVHAATNPKGARLKKLKVEQAALPEVAAIPAAAEPFFAQFLENQRPLPDAAASEPPGMMVTMRYPSDNEDGGVDDIGGGDMVTMRYPSDNEDGGVDHIGGGELGGPSNRPQPFLSRDGLKLERDINKSAYHGHTRMADRIDELGQTIAARPDAATEREHRMLSAFYGGFDAIEAAIAEIDGLRQRALLDPAQLGRLSDDRLLLVGLRSDIERYNDALTRLAAGSSTEDTIAAGIFKKAFYGGDELRKRAAEIDDLLPRARLTHEAFRALVVERACIEVFGGGQPGIAERMGQIEQQLNDPELSTEGRETVSLEYGVYKRLQEGLAPFIERVVALDATLTAMGTP